MLNLGPLEIGFVLGIVILLFGPDKIPQLARNMGKATKEYQKALKGLNESGTSALDDVKSEVLDHNETSDSNKSEDEQIFENAKKLGIETEGKTVDQLVDEILEVTDNT